MKFIVEESQLKVIVEKYKIGNEERDKLLEDDDFIFLIPLTHTASCKYGAGTKWCVTEKDSDLFERHDAMGTLGFLIVKKPDMQEKFNNNKFAYFINRPSSLEASYDFNRVIIYDDKNNVMPIKIFLNYANEFGFYDVAKTSLIVFMEYARKKFSTDNKEIIKKGVQNPF